MARKADKTSPDMITVVWSTYVKYRGEWYAAGENTEIQASDYDELARLGVIQQ